MYRIGVMEFKVKRETYGVYLVIFLGHPVINHLQQMASTLLSVMVEGSVVNQLYVYDPCKQFGCCSRLTIDIYHCDWFGFVSFLPVTGKLFCHLSCPDSTRQWWHSSTVFNR